MVTKIEVWRTDDDKDFNTEVEALRHENENLRKQLHQLNWQINCQPKKYDKPEGLYTGSIITGMMPMANLDYLNTR